MYRLLLTPVLAIRRSFPGDLGLFFIWLVLLIKTCISRVLIGYCYCEEEDKQSISAKSEKEPNQLSPTSRLQARVNANLKKTRTFVSIIY